MQNRSHAAPDRESSCSLSFNPAALLPANANAANAAAEEAIPAPEGKLFSLITSARSSMSGHAANEVENIRDAIQPMTCHFMPVDDQLIERQRRLKADRRARVQSIQVHRDGTVAWEGAGRYRGCPSI